MNQLLVIDCDYKCPNLHNIFTLPSYPGVADYLAGEASIRIVFPTNLRICRCGCMPAGDMEF